MNVVVLKGRLTKMPDVRITDAGKTVARFTLAVDKFNKDSGTNFINCVCFGTTAQNAEKYLNKGTAVCVSGSWETGNYKNKDGATVYTNECAVQRWEFCESKKKQEQEQEPTFAPIDETIDAELPFV